jgi:type I restriction enzyme S subunit
MKTLKIKDICDKGSSSLKQKDVENQNGKYPVFGASGLIGKIDTYHQNKEYIAIVKDGSGIGRVSFMPAFSSVIGTLQYILPKEGYNIKYISYCLQSLDLANYKQGAAIPHIYFRDYGEYEVNVEENPDDQQRIVTYLDAEFAKIEALKANAEKQLQAAKDLFQAALKELLTPKDGWVEKKLGEVAEIIRGKRFVRADIVEEGVPCIHYGDIYTHYGLSVTKTRGCVKPELAKKLRFAKKNDVIVVQAGENNWDIGVGVAYFGEEPAVVHDACFILRHKQNPMYISYYLRTYNYHLYLLDYVHEGKICSFLKPALENAPIALPPLAEQQQIVNKLDAISAKVKALQTNYTETITLCNDLKQALLKKVFE